jgi:hypothetical protein
MPRDFLAENRSAALDFARKRREKAEAATAARQARKTAESEAIAKQEAYAAEVEAYHAQARARGVDYGGGAPPQQPWPPAGGGGQVVDARARERELEPAESWDDVPIGAAVRVTPQRQQRQEPPGRGRGRGRGGGRGRKPKVKDGLSYRIMMGHIVSCWRHPRIEGCIYLDNR